MILIGSFIFFNLSTSLYALAPSHNINQEKLSRRELDEILGWDHPRSAFDFEKAKHLISFFKRVPELKFLFEQHSGSIEGVTIETHTLQVLDHLEHLLSNQFDLVQMPWKRLTYVAPLMRLLVALHDIGKPYALEKYDKELASRYTVPIMERVLKRLHFEADEIRFLTAMVEINAIGHLLQDFISQKEAFEQIQKAAQKSGLELETFFDIFELFYIADASSYPFLTSVVGVFELVDDKKSGSGKRIIIHRKYKSFYELKWRINDLKPSRGNKEQITEYAM